MKKREANEIKNMSQYISSRTQNYNLENKQESFPSIPHANGLISFFEIVDMSSNVTCCAPSKIILNIILLF